MLYFLLLLMGVNSSLAHTDAKFFGFLGMISMSDTYGGQKIDDDPIELYRLMNVEERQESLGKGKSIKLADKSLTIVCADRTNNDVCTIVVKNSDYGQVSPGKITFYAEGSLGQELSQKFFSNRTDGHMQFETTDKKLKIRTGSSLFSLEFLARP
ncbi:MAG: hypothetical protein M9962_05250 [Oligoflexia bacterium]|nr:hypothetical protein [Oligoflexia bacterium]